MMKKTEQKSARVKPAAPSDHPTKLEQAGTRRTLATDDAAATSRELRQPNERDESADEQLTTPRRVIKQAHDDLQSGQQDTDARNRVAEVLPNVPKTPQNFEASNPLDTAPGSKKKTSS